MYVGKHVKILLQSNLIVEGIVKEWAPSQVSVESIEEKSISIILHPQQDIRVVKIYDHDNVTNASAENITQKLDAIPQKITNDNSATEKKFEEVYQSPSDNELRLKNLVELKSELIKEEKEIIASKLKSHTLGEVRQVKYEQPRFFKK